MEFVRKNGKGLLLCLAIALPAWLLVKYIPALSVVGAPVIAILAGMLIAVFLKDQAPYKAGVSFTSKKILQTAVVLLGFGLDLATIGKVGKTSMPVIVSTIATSLIVAALMQKLLHIPSKISTLIGVGSSICGGSAIAATAPVIDADDEEVAQAISVIFFFNVLAAVLFPLLGSVIGFSTASGESFGIFAGTAVNDTSSVTAAASTWDSMWNLGSATLDKAVTVKLTRTLAIIPITLVLAFVRARKERASGGESSHVDFRRIFPFFILYFVAASVITTAALHFGVPAGVFSPVKELSKFFIVLAMAAIGLNSNIVKLVRTGGKPLLTGACCWAGITGVSLLMQHVMGIW